MYKREVLIARHPQRVLTIRYEDFLSDQAHTLQRVCAFFGIDFLPRMLDIANSPEARHISRMSELWASNCFAPIAANADKFKQQLSTAEIATIETLAHEYMQRYGYQQMTDATAMPDAFAAAAARPPGGPRGGAPGGRGGWGGARRGRPPPPPRRAPPTP